MQMKGKIEEYIQPNQLKMERSSPSPRMWPKLPPREAQPLSWCQTYRGNVWPWWLLEQRPADHVAGLSSGVPSVRTSA